MVDIPIPGSKSSTNNVPAKIKGSLLPKDEENRSLNAPATGCTNIASIKPTKVSTPR